MSKVVDIFGLNFGISYDARLPNMVISRDPRQILKFFYFVLILHSILLLRKTTIPLVKKLSTSEVISQNLKGHRKY